MKTLFPNLERNRFWHKNRSNISSYENCLGVDLNQVDPFNKTEQICIFYKRNSYNFTINIKKYFNEIMFQL